MALDRFFSPFPHGTSCAIGSFKYPTFRGWSPYLPSIWFDVLWFFSERLEKQRVQGFHLLWPGIPPRLFIFFQAFGVKSEVWSGFDRIYIRSLGWSIFLEVLRCFTSPGVFELHSICLMFSFREIKGSSFFTYPLPFVVVYVPFLKDLGIPLVHLSFSLRLHEYLHFHGSLFSLTEKHESLSLVYCLVFT